jgi:hypothetical protein
MSAWLAELSQIPPSTLAIGLIGGFIILLVVAFYRPAGSRIIRFLSDLLALFSRPASGSTRTASPSEADDQREGHQL